MAKSKSKKLTVKAETKLERAVKAWVNSGADDYGDGAEGVLRDLFQGGCASGAVGGLIYYKDTIPFYKRNKAEIQGLLKDMMNDTGLHSPKELFGDKWDDDDMFAEDTLNQNLLAWFGFEETARKLADRAGIEV
jgi:hypothetical protein